MYATCELTPMDFIRGQRILEFGYPTHGNCEMNLGLLEE